MILRGINQANDTSIRFSSLHCLILLIFNICQVQGKVSRAVADKNWGSNDLGSGKDFLLVESRNDSHG